MAYLPVGARKQVADKIEAYLLQHGVSYLRPLIQYCVVDSHYLLSPTAVKQVVAKLVYDGRLEIKKGRVRLKVGE